MFSFGTLDVFVLMYIFPPGVLQTNAVCSHCIEFNFPV